VHDGARRAAARCPRAGGQLERRLEADDDLRRLRQEQVHLAPGAEQALEQTEPVLRPEAPVIASVTAVSPASLRCAPCAQRRLELAVQPPKSPFDMMAT
jgi:hypothetical protein